MQNPEPAPPAPAVSPESIAKVAKIIAEPPQVEMNVYGIDAEAAEEATIGYSVIKPEKKLSRKESKKIAEHMACELHPWRKGYAICDYCKRPFCYEDIIEHDGTYYCLDDIDKVPQEMRTAEVVRYSRLSLISAVFFMFVFLIVVYYNYGQIHTVFIAMAQSGLRVFLSNIGAQTEILFAESILALLSFVNAILVIASTRISFRFSTLVGLLTVLLFSYEFLNTQQPYLAAVAVLSFSALISLAYSRVAYETLEEENEKMSTGPLETLIPKSL